MATLASNSLTQVALPKNTVIVAQRTGRLYVLDFSECPQLDDPGAVDWDVSVSKILLAKVGLSRNRLSTLEEVEFENIVRTGQAPAGSPYDLKVTLFKSLDGKNLDAGTSLYTAIEDGGFLRMNCRQTAINFAIQLRGTYNINTIQVALHPAGRR